MDNFEIFFRDLNVDAQLRVLAFLNLDGPAEGNYDVFPLASIPKPVDDPEAAGSSAEVPDVTAGPNGRVDTNEVR